MPLGPEECPGRPRGLLGGHLLDVVAQQLVLLWKRGQCCFVEEMVAWAGGSCSSRRGNDKSGPHQGR